MTESAWLGIDLGTSALKCGIWDRYGRCLARTRMPMPGPAEALHAGSERHQRPEDWQRLLVESLGQMRSTLDKCRPQAMAVVAHAPSPVLVDADGRALATAPTWLDPLSAEHRAELSAALVRPAGTGSERLAVAAAARALAVRRADPTAFAKARHVLHASDFLASWLIAQPVSTTPTWAPALAAAQVTRIVDPRLVQPGDVIGALAPERSHALGLPVGLPVVAGGLDSFAGSIGSGITRVSDACLNLGSSTVISYLAPPSTPGRFQWLGLSLVSEPLRRTEADTGYEAERRLLTRMAGLHHPPRRVRAVGGAALNDASMQMRADALQASIEIVANPVHASALGAALLAACATDASASHAATVESMVQVAHIVHPQPGTTTSEQTRSRQ